MSGLGGVSKVVDGDNLLHLLRFPFQKRGPASSVLRACGLGVERAINNPKGPSTQ